MISPTFNYSQKQLDDAAEVYCAYLNYFNAIVPEPTSYEKLYMHSLFKRGFEPGQAVLAVMAGRAATLGKL